MEILRKTAGNSPSARIARLSGKIVAVMTSLGLILSGVPGTVMAQPPAAPLSLKDVEVKEPPNLNEFIKNKEAAIALGKALFWDMQVGSDGVQACASCHFKAGADPRTKNQINPGTLGADNEFGNPEEATGAPGIPQFAPNYRAGTGDFPFHSRGPETTGVPRPVPAPEDEFSNVLRDCNDVFSSQGVRFTKFLRVVPGLGTDLGWPLYDPVFNLKNKNIRRVEPRNTPTMINAVFNGDNFWDGRASMVFNGVNPFGFRDQTSTLKKNVNGALTDELVRIPYGSLASQAVGPPVSDFEMSFQGRDFPAIGRKMLVLRPLAKQLVHPQDSVLGNLSRASLFFGKVVGAKGLKEKNYAEMVKKAFQDEWWNSPDVCTIVDGTQYVHTPKRWNPRTFVVNHGKVKVRKWKAGMKLGDKDYTQMEYNFSLFFGLAVQLYEATLIADDTPWDRFVGANYNVRGDKNPIPADPTALTDQEKLGLDLFQGTNLSGKNPGPFIPGCHLCHSLPEGTEHSIDGLAVGDDGVPRRLLTILPDGNGGRFVATGTAYIDFGMRNVGHRPSDEDFARATTAPDLPPFQNPLDGNKPFPLAYVELAKLKKANLLPVDVAQYVPDLGVDVFNPIGLPPPAGDRVVTKGCVKVPNVRLSKWTGPYFHDGGYSTLRQVVQFYVRGGNFPATDFNEIALGILPLPPMDPEVADPVASAAAEEKIQALVAFLANGLSDKRVEYQKAPFDHPELYVPEGSPDRVPQLDYMLHVPPVGKYGQNKPIATFLDLDPQAAQ